MIWAGFALLNSDKIPQIVAEIGVLANHVEENSTRLAKAAETCAQWGFERAWYLGSGAFKGLVQEGALKMMELTNGAVVAGYDSAPGFRHGPKTVMNDRTLTVHFLSSDPFTHRYDLDLLKELHQEKTENWVVALYDEATDTPPADVAVAYAQQGFSFCTHLAVGMQGLLFMQMLSMFKSLALNVPTDNPSPTGLVNRVVQGVTVYSL
jgi:tagatose-6-phosphate ketose/aldose isomerase